MSQDYQPNNNVWMGSILLIFLGVYLIFFMSILALFKMKGIDINRNWSIYIVCVVVIWLVFHFVHYNRYRFSRFHSLVEERGERLWGLFALETLLIGFIPSFYIFQIMPQTLFFGLLAAVFLYSLFNCDLDKNYFASRKLLTFIDKVAAFFCIGFLMLTLPIWLFHKFQFLYQMRNASTGWGLGFYIACLFLVGSIFLMLIYDKLRSSSLFLWVKVRGRAYSCLFAVEMLLIGFIPSFYVFSILSHGVFIWYLPVVLLFSLSLSAHLNRKHIPGRSMLIFIDTTAASFYIGLLPLAFSIWIFHILQRLYQFTSEYSGVSGKYLILMSLLAIFDLALNIVLGNLMSQTQDYTGGYEASNRANWVYTRTREFVRHANRRETGEWKPPMNPVAKLFWLNVFMILATVFAHTAIDPTKPVNQLLIYNIFLFLFLAWYFRKFRKSK